VILLLLSSSCVILQCIVASGSASGIVHCNVLSSGSVAVHCTVLAIGNATVHYNVLASGSSTVHCNEPLYSTQQQC
jgi:hypothetical protein